MCSIEHPEPTPLLKTGGRLTLFVPLEPECSDVVPFLPTHPGDPSGASYLFICLCVFWTLICDSVVFTSKLAHLKVFTYYQK